MSSKTEDECVNTFGIRGFPAKCVCGLDSTIYTSKTQTNPGRPFFRCPTKIKDHLLKWVEEAVLEKVEDAKVEAEAMKAIVMELKAELMITKGEVRRSKWLMKICTGACCLIVLVSVVLMLMITLCKDNVREDVLRHLVKA